MSAAGVTDALVEAIDSGDYDFIVANYANPDMVGHTGVWDATIEGLAAVDESLGRVVEAIERIEAADPDGPGAILAITADHGNADDLRDDGGRPVTAHSLNPVPFLLVGRSAAGRRLARRGARRCRADHPRACRPADLAGHHRSLAAG